MNKQNLMPHTAQPVYRTPTGQLPPELAELSEELLQLQGDAFSISVLPSVTGPGTCGNICSHDGDDAE